METGKWLQYFGLDEEKVIEACKLVKSGFVVPANFNTVGQIVISGEEDAVIEAGEKAKELGAKKVSVLNTAGPFHTEKLERCSEELIKELGKVKINHKNSKVVKNLDGKAYQESDDVVDILSKHIMNPVRFTYDLQTMYDKGIDTFIEIGPRKNFKWLCKKDEF